MAEQGNEGFKISWYRLFSCERTVRSSWLVADAGLDPSTSFFTT